MRIGEAAQRVGVSASALRQWERQGLLKPVRSRSAYRLYSEADIEHLTEIRRMRAEDRVNAPGIRRLLGRRAHDGAHETVADGAALRELRAGRGLSLQQAAERSGLSASLISGIERGSTAASVASLARLTSSYGVTLGELIPRPGARRVVRRAERRALDLGDESVRIEQLANRAARLEPQLFHLAPGAASQGAYRHDGEEFLYVLAGSLTIWVGDRERYVLRTGDALTFPSSLPHRWRSTLREETSLLWINTPPTF
jgi:DNA-binding transcriptional MerR regulator